MKKLIACFWALTLCLSALSTTRYRDFTVRDGLVGSSVKTIFQDSRGLMWFGTWSGISRFDGRTFTSITSSPFEADTPTYDVVSRFTEHPDGSIWFSTELGINRLDPYTMKCKRFYISYSPTFSGSRTFSIDISPDGTVFCGAQGWGMAVWDSAKDTMEPFIVPDIECSSISDLYCFGTDRLLVRNGNGQIYFVDYEKDGADLQVAGVTKLSAETISTLWKLDGGKAAAQIGESLMIIDGDGGVKMLEDILGGANVTSICTSPDGRICIVIDEKKAILADPSSGMIEDISLDGLENILSVYCGSQGTFWAGIDGVGVRLYYDSGVNFSEIRSEDLFGASSSFIDVEEGWYSDLIISSLGNGLAFIDSAGKTRIASMIAGPSTAKIFSVTKGFNPGELLIGDEHMLGLIRYDSSGRMTYRPLYDLMARVYAILPDPEQNCIWAGSFGNGVIRLQCKSSCDRYDLVASGSWELSDMKVTSIIKDSYGRIWAGTFGGGINIIDPADGSISVLGAGNGNSALSSNIILDMMNGSDGSVWAGTGHGLNHIRLSGREVDVCGVWTTQNGLSDNTIHALSEDAEGNIWVSTTRGIACIENAGEAIVNYNDERLVKTYEFCNHSCVRLSSGQLCFGGIGGCCTFYPQEIHPRDFVPSILFTSFFSRENMLDNNTSKEGVKLSHNQNNFIISFSALDYINSENCEFRYRLKGFDNGWIQSGTGGKATYTNIPPGKYSFEVSSTNGDKIPVDNLASMDITILRPWWARIWALCIWILLFISLCASAFRLLKSRRDSSRALAMEAVEKEHQKETYEAKLNFFTNVAHEFGTPLTLIASSAEHLQSLLSSRSQESKDVKTIKSSSARMQKLIDEIMDFSKVEAGKYEARYSKFDARATLYEILENFTEINDKNGISLHLDLPDDSLDIISDYSAVEKILTNLVSNAYKYTPVGGDIDVTLKRQGEGLLFSIRNSGKGIKAEDLPKVFDRFRILDTFEKQVKDETIRRNGIGMAFVKSLTDMLSGSVSVTSERDAGTTFTLELPGESPDKVDAQILTVDYDEPDTEVGKDSFELPDRDKRLILAVDDEKKVLEVISSLLADQYRVITADSVSSALTLVKKETPDLILSDISMPDMNGMDFLKTIKGDRMTRNIPFIFVAFRTDPENEIAAYRMGCDAIVRKPFNPKQFKAIIDGLFAKRDSLKEYYTSALSDLESYDGRVISSEDKDFLTRMVSVIERNLTNPDLSIDFIASEMCISRSKMNSSLKDLAGMTPSEFIISVKVGHATRLLKVTSLNVQEIMYSSGFNNKSYFFREFKKAHGVTPKQFREENCQ